MDRRGNLPSAGIAGTLMYRKGTSSAIEKQSWSRTTGVGGFISIPVCVFSPVISIAVLTALGFGLLSGGTVHRHYTGVGLLANCVVMMWIRTSKIA